MKPFLLTLAAVTVSTALSAETVRFTDGTDMEVASYEIREHVVVLMTADGKLRSVPKSFVHLDELADEEAMLAEALELLHEAPAVGEPPVGAAAGRRGVMWRPCSPAARRSAPP